MSKLKRIKTAWQTTPHRELREEESAKDKLKGPGQEGFLIPCICFQTCLKHSQTLEVYSKCFYLL